VAYLLSQSKYVDLKKSRIWDFCYANESAFYDWGGGCSWFIKKWSNIEDPQLLKARYKIHKKLTSGLWDSNPPSSKRPKVWMLTTAPSKLPINTSPLPHVNLRGVSLSQMEGKYVDLKKSRIRDFCYASKLPCYTSPLPHANLCVVVAYLLPQMEGKYISFRTNIGYKDQF